MKNSQKNVRHGYLIFCYIIYNFSHGYNICRNSHITKCTYLDTYRSVVYIPFHDMAALLDLLTNVLALNDD